MAASGDESQGRMECGDLYRTRKLLFVNAALSVANIGLTMLAMVSVNVNGVEVVGPEVERDATLLRDSECRPESAGQTAVCVDNALADLLPGDLLDDLLFSGGALGFSFVLFALMAAVPAALMCCAALFDRTDRLPYKLQGQQPMMLALAVFAACELVAFAGYAGIVNGDADADDKDMRYGFGFGLTIIGWMSGCIGLALTYKAAPNASLRLSPPPQKKEKTPRPGPSGGAGGAAAGALPAPWRAVVDPESGDTYYWNPSTNMTSWDRPTDSVAAGAAAAGAAVAGRV